MFDNNNRSNNISFPFGTSEYYLQNPGVIFICRNEWDYITGKNSTYRGSDRQTVQTTQWCHYRYLRSIAFPTVCKWHSQFLSTSQARSLLTAGRPLVILLRVFSTSLLMLVRRWTRHFFVTFCIYQKKASNMFPSFTQISGVPSVLWLVSCKYLWLFVLPASTNTVFSCLLIRLILWKHWSLNLV